MALIPRLAPWFLTIVDALLVLAALLLVALRLRRKNRAAANFPPAFCAFARHGAPAAFSVGMLVIVLRVALLPILGIPQPRWNDEFSYILAGKTFAAGRIMSPAHPLWIHFETFDINQRPTYMSMYPPGQGLVLAVGERLAHQPWVGVLLITALACTAITWMLQGWVPPEWALFGGLLAAFRIAILSFWMNSFWVPGLAATGGALVLGAYPRLRQSARIRDSVWMALGLIILANSRPYEGLIFSIPFAVVLASWLIGSQTRPHPRAFRRAAVVLALLLVAGGAATGYYYGRVTGNPFRFAYQVNRDRYAVVPYFIFFSKRPAPEYHHAVMRDYYLGWEPHEFEQYHTLSGFLRQTGRKVVELWHFYFGALLSIPLLGLPLLRRDRRMRFPLAVAIFFGCGLLIQTWTLPHYVAPAAGLLYLFIIQSLRHMRLWRWHGLPAGNELIRAIAAVSVGWVLVRVFAIVLHLPLEPRWPRGNLDRPPIVAKLSQLPAPQLVFVRYGPHHDVDHEWVFNEPDIDHAKIVWARDMGPQNQEVRRYYPERQAWLLDGDESPPRLTPIP